MKDKLIIIGGPTAVGKTSISISIAKKLETEIISADSMQIYKHMDIGSAKISKEEMCGVQHHMIDIVEPWENFSAAEFKVLAERHIRKINQMGKIPLIVGGTGLYIDSIICNYNFTDANKDEKYREELEKLAESHGNEFVFEILKSVDQAAAAKLHANNLKRVIRALEVFKLTGKPFSEYTLEDTEKFDVPYDIYYYVLNMNRSVLYERINQRVDIMLEKGLIEEVNKLKALGCNANMQSMKGIGYKELLYYLDGVLTLEEAIDSIKQGSRNYAKRQLTWFKKDPRVKWINREDFSSEEAIVEFILKDLQL